MGSLKLFDTIEESLIFLRPAILVLEILIGGNNRFYLLMKSLDRAPLRTLQYDNTWLIILLQRIGEVGKGNSQLGIAR